jgi:hypothetical protein
MPIGCLEAVVKMEEVESVLLGRLLTVAGFKSSRDFSQSGID